MHGCSRAVLNQVWKLGPFPRKASGCPARKHGSHPVVLAKQDIRRVIEALPEPTKSVVVGSLWIGEVTT
jgi:hypothetical protein